LSVDKTPPVASSIGTEILGATLVAIDADSVTFDVNGRRTRLSFPASSSSTATRDPVRLSDQQVGPMARALAPAVDQVLAPLASTQKVGTGNAAFLDAIEKASERARAR
jgi:hypothetical protein